MARLFRAARWLLSAILRKSFAGLKWLLRKLGLTRLFGLGVGGGVGAFFGSSTGVAFGGGAVVGSWFFVPLLAIIGVLLAPIMLLRMRRKRKKDDEGDI